MKGGRPQVAVEDFRLAQRAALDCIPAMRRTVLDTLLAGHAISDAPGPKSTLHYAVEELEGLGLLEGGELSKLSIGLLDRGLITRV